VVTSRPYSYAGHFLPHDAGPNRIGIDKSYRDFLTDHGLRNITILPAGNVQHGINLTRLLLPRCHFDSNHCHLGIEALKMYRAKFDEKNKTLGASPIHDWSSHGADAFRYLAVGLDQHITPSNFNRKIVYPKLGMA
jgi:phage terminase large subunit